MQVLRLQGCGENQGSLLSLLSQRSLLPSACHPCDESSIPIRRLMQRHRPSSQEPLVQRSSSSAFSAGGTPLQQKRHFHTGLVPRRESEISFPRSQWHVGMPAGLAPSDISAQLVYVPAWSFFSGSEFAGPGAGLRASYAIAPLAVPDPLVLGLDQQSPLPVAPQQLQSVSVASTAGLLRAAVDPAITLITVSAHLRLNGTTLVVDGPGRSLTVQSDPLACGSLSRGAVPGLCTLDAGSLARHFQVCCPWPMASTRAHSG